MFNWIIKFSIDHKLIIGICVAALIGWGIFSLTHLPLDAVPDITDNQVQVITQSPNLSAQEVERFITFPLEMEMGNIPDVEEIRSISRFGLSVITIVFRERSDIYWAREQINQKIQLAKADIPEGMGNPEMGPISTGLGEVYQYVIYPAEGFEDQYDATELRSIQDWVIKRQLTGVPGVVEVNSSGGYLKQYAIAIDQSKLRGFDLSMADVFDAVAANNANAGGSYIEKSTQTYFIRGEGIVQSASDLEQIVVKFQNGTPLLLGQIAEVTIDHAPRFGAVTMNGKGEVVAGQVMMLKGENSMEVTRRIKERIGMIKESLPEGIVLEPYLDRSKLVNNTTRTVITNLVEGALIVIFILVLLLGNLRAGLIVASVIPLSMLFAVSMMRIFGVSANLMSLGALDFGLIVDGAVIIVEAILHHLGMRNRTADLTSAEKEQAVFTAASRIRKSAAFGEIIILIVYVPILFLQGIEGKMFIPMAQTVSFAILGAFILSMTYVPMMSALFLKHAKVSEDGISTRIIRTLYSWYAPVREVAFRFKYLVLALAVGLFVLSLLTLTRMGGEFIPTLEEGDFALHQILPTGSSLQKGIEVSGKLQDILTSKFPEVEKVVTKIGTAEIPTDIMPLEAGDIYVIMKPKSEWVSARSREEMFLAMEEELNKFPGVAYEFTQPIQMRFNELMTGVRQDIAIKIYGENLGVLAQKARDAEVILEGINGVGDIQVEATVGLQQLVVKYDRRKMAQYGISIDQLNDIVQTAFAGKVAGTFYERERKFDVVVRLRSEERQDIESLTELQVKLPGGGFIPMSEVARIAFEEGPAQISRDDTKRRITIGVNARNRDIASLISDIQTAFAAELDLPAGYYVRYGGQFENLQRARDRLLVVVPIALTLIFLLLYFTFQSAVQALLIFTAIPLSAIGGIWALYLRDMPVSISAGVGFVALFGVAVLNGIVLVAYFNQLKKEGMTDIMKIVREGTRVRLRPVIMTASVASLGFLPMALSTTAGAEVQRPLATVVIGGLISATILTLIVLPILYSIFQRVRSSRVPHTLILALLLALTGTIHAQEVRISLPEALEIVDQRDNGLIASIALQKTAITTRASDPLPSTPLEVSFSSEEFRSGREGVNSLNVGKVLRPVQLKKKTSALYNAKLAQLDNVISLSKMAMKQATAETYIEAAYLEAMMSLEAARKVVYEEFLEISSKRAQAGDSGTIPVRQASLAAEDIDIILEGLRAQKALYLDLLNSWLRGQNYEVYALDQVPFTQQSIAVQDHPNLRAYDLQQDILARQADIVSLASKPQWVTGARLQMLQGELLFFGYELGVQIPLSKSYTSQQIAAIQSESLALAERQKWEQEQLERIKKSFQESARVQQLRIERISAHLLELNALTQDMMRAYQFGEVDYTDVITSYESYFDLQREKIELTKAMLLNINQYVHYVQE